MFRLLKKMLNYPKKYPNAVNQDNADEIIKIALEKKNKK